jgi:hypothetical protein
MITEKQRPPKAQRKFGNVWGELKYVCGKIRFWLYVKQHETSARLFLDRLKRILEGLPASNLAILQAEGFALFHELEGNQNAAIKYRRREIERMEKLLAEAESPGVQENTRAFMLAGRDRKALQERRAILQALEKVEPMPRGRRS